MAINSDIVGISTDLEVATILSNFSDDMIEDVIRESIMEYRFRPFTSRGPNYPEILNNQILNIKYHSTGHDDEIEQKRIDVQRTIIDAICKAYNLSLSDYIPDEKVYTISYIMYQLFVSEFTIRSANFYTQFIVNHMHEMIKQLDLKDKNIKSVYSKKIYTDTNYIIIYDNIDKITDILCTLDIELPDLIEYLSDKNTSDLLSEYLVDNGDCYQEQFAPFLVGEDTRAAMITQIRFNFVSLTQDHRSEYGLNNIVKGE